MIRFLPITLGLLCIFCSILRAAAVPEVPRIELAKITGQADTPATPLTLWYREPAQLWEEAMPIGNGRLGAMIFGGLASERLQLNEDTIWEGYPRDVNNPAALSALPKIRELLFQDKDAEATDLITKTMMGVPPRIKSYQPLGDLFLDTPDLTTAQNYRRELNLDTAIAAVRYRIGDATFTREIFASNPDQVIVVRLTCDKPGRITTTLSMKREKDAQVHAQDNYLILAGQIITKYADSAPEPAMKFQGEVLALPTGGIVHVISRIPVSIPPSLNPVAAPATGGDSLSVTNADSLLLLIAAATDYHHDDPAKACDDTLKKASAKSYDQLLAAHLADYQNLFRRVTLDLGPANNQPTNERVAAADPTLLPEYFQFGRYLLISSSRPGSMPANLQGLWNDKLNASWNSDYHTNINIQMNYWPAEVTNLSECHQPLFDLMDSLVAPGSRTAKIEYGCGGWVVHHLTDPFGFTAPADGPQGVWPMGAAWLCEHPYEHYLFTGDKTFLANRAYPLMKGAAQFILDFLVESPPGAAMSGKLVTAPSHSPENKFYLPNGQTSALTYGATMDLEIIHELLTNCIAASTTLDVDPDFRAQCQSALERLAPLQISKDGRLQEWIEDYKETDPHHRHTSHLYAVYPSDQINLSATPDLAAAAQKSLEARTDKGATEWSFAWRACLWARFLDGDHANQLLTELMSKDLYPNLFNKYPPFQIDGNFGATTAVAEMLLQSQSNEIRLLPALPKAWPNGKVTGLRARGGFQIDIAWKNNALILAMIQSIIGSPIRIRSAIPLTVMLDGQPILTTHSQPDLIEFPTQPAQTFLLTPTPAIH
jgi:alpha-L-fucosidase 2